MPIFLFVVAFKRLITDMGGQRLSKDKLHDTHKVVVGKIIFHKDHMFDRKIELICDLTATYKISQLVVLLL